ncbi:butyrophilin subfamily 3 member A3-like isoform X1 [Hypanus sabinus]|uniref:butyrophilin subfamily 3 member A3-like n=1 Tax=Hypanus sabinus TaxID=79690 RepID=UPI0028C48145|nr:butyrophilin subfamily 3 member A3-like [Hypanus sabinus]XP_059826995.1 butyrophilin subfamily 3 member A3-like [Hypanus sabinus]XP_059827012.1 butyrophilin subfamily 3 member A3-like isoform X1 [Hypanus sabinus]XP_059827013.1 butyrophilin subfamily 3 member A3-like isoform X1 [Hypanus sabinus]
MEQIYLAVCLLPVVLNSAHGKFQVIGPERPVIAIVGEDVRMDCKVVPTESSSNMALQWLKTDLHSAVHEFRNERDAIANQDPAYRGRTELFKDQIDKGNVSLRIKNIRVADEGTYICSVDNGIDFEETSIVLQVAALGYEHWINIGGYRKNEIQLVCESNGWYPKPLIQWISGDKKNLTSKSEINYNQDSKGLINAKSKIFVSKDSTNRSRCILENQVLKKGQEATIEIADVFFPVVSGWLVFLCLLLCLLLIALGLGIFWTLRRRKYMKGLEDDESVKQYGHWKPLVESDWEIMCKNPASIKLDTETAHRQLEISKDQKSVRLTNSQTDVPENEERFTAWECVLGSDEFTSGKHYWEVEVAGNHKWSLGIAGESANRKGDLTLKPKNKFWSIGQNEKEIHANDNDKSNISYQEIPRKIGVYLDYDTGVVSFYDANTKSFLYTFNEKFSEKLYPFFHTTHQKRWLKICSKQETKPSNHSKNNVI